MKPELIIGIVDDDQRVRKKIKKKIELILNPQQIKVRFKLYADGLEIVNSRTLHDIIFLDYEMPGLNGIETLIKLNQTSPKPLVIFLSGIEQPLEVVRASVSLHPFDFLLKGDPHEKFEAVLSRAVLNINNRKYLEITHYGNSQYKAQAKVYVNEIVSLFADGKICYINMESGEEYATRKPMAFWLEKIAQAEFVYVNKNNLVNLKNVEKFEDNIVYLSNDDELNLSRTYKKTFKQAWSNYLLFGEEK
ncbi:MAG: response regulator [Defluviitaleaceae bacterium]|nr:response regulator [Defluviitaleaceae bacterium]